MNVKNEQLFINGEFIKGEGKERAIIDPASGRLITVIQEASGEQAREAVQGAERAFVQTDWAQNQSLRIKVLRRLSDLLEASAETFAEIETQNTGKPIRESRLDISDAVSCLRYYADLQESKKTWSKEMDDGSISRVIEGPMGVCVLIVPWNFPLLLGIWKLAPALAAGNAVVFKPSEWTPLSFLTFAKLVKEAGLPDGIFNLVTGDGSSVGQELIKHGAVRKVSFTGSSKTGQLINRECAGTFKRVSLELGGKSPLLVFDDADIEAACDIALFSSYFNQGQVCVAASRILVQDSLYDSFLARLTERAKQIKIGDPRDEETEMGPVISQEHLAKIEHYIRAGKEEGARLVTGGERIIPQTGYYITPAVFTDVNQSMKIVQEEIFGPVITVQEFSNEDEAISLANGTRFGLAAGILTENEEKALRTAESLHAGIIWINSYHTPYLEAPWGGVKQSGIGRELGPYGLASFTEPKHINITSKLNPVEWYQWHPSVLNKG